MSCKLQSVFYIVIGGLFMSRENCYPEKLPDKMYKIGMFAAMNHVTIKTLRHYDEQGLLIPAYIDGMNGYRYYKAGQIADLHQILALKNIGFSLDEIKEIIGGKSERDLLQLKKKNILKEIAQLTAQLSQIESYLMEADIDVATHVLIKPLPEVKLATMRATLGSYDELFDIMPRMGAEMERVGCVCQEPEYCFTHYLDGEYKEEQVQVETCEAVTEIKEDTEILKFKVFQEVKEAACIFHKGPYESLSKAYSKLLKFIEDNGYEICGHPRESYIDGVWNRESEEDWLTEIQIPISR